MPLRKRAGGRGPVDQSTVRLHNLGLVLRHVADHGPRSRARIAAETGLNKTTVSSLASELIERGLLREAESENPGGVGRPGTAAESYEIWQKVAAAGVMHLCGFNYRFVPAVRLARELLDTGELGDVRHFRASYLKDSGVGPMRTGWRYDPVAAGSGVLADLASHVIDLGRYLVGEIASVSALVRTFVEGRLVDDSVEAAVEFEGGAVGTIEATKLALGRRNAFRWELNGSKGSLAFDLERMNELEVFRDDGDRARGFRQVLVSERDHPFWSRWWPPGHTIGWAETFVHELDHLLTAIADDGQVGPHGATFEDGYRAAEVSEAMLRSSERGHRETVVYRALP